MKLSYSFRFAATALLIAGLSIRSSADEQRQRASNSSPAASRAGTETKLDLNTADVKALESEPVIGADGARAIIAVRSTRHHGLCEPRVTYPGTAIRWRSPTASAPAGIEGRGRSRACWETQ